MTGTKFDEGKPAAIYFYVGAAMKAEYQLDADSNNVLYLLINKLERMLTEFTEDGVVHYDSVRYTLYYLIAFIRQHYPKIDILKEVSIVGKLGATKYGLYNYKGLTQDRILNALCRHLVQDSLGETLDSESHQHHVIHALCNLYMLLDITAQPKELL